MASRLGYFASTRHPWPCLLFVLPLLVAYEAGVLMLGGADAGALSTFLSHAQRGEYVPPDLDDVEHMCAQLRAWRRDFAATAHLRVADTGEHIAQRICHSHLYDSLTSST